MYIYLIDNKVYLTIPIIAGSDIATDNTCKTFKVLQNYIDNVQTELDFFDNLFELLGDRYTSQRAQIQQYKNIVESLRQQEAFSGLQKDNFNTRELKELLNQSNSMVLDPQTNRDNFLKSSNPTFSLQHERFSEQEVTKSILGLKLREAITNLERIKLDAPSIDNFKDVLPDIDINDAAPLKRCKEAWLQAGFTEEDQWSHAKGALEERIKLMVKHKDEETISFDKNQLCGSLDSVWPIITENQVSFNSFANDIFTSTESEEVKIDKIAVLTQFFLGNLNIYLKDIDRETINLGEIFDSSEDLSRSLASIVQESLTTGGNTEDIIINFIHESLSINLLEEQKQEVKKLFINRYITIKDSDHFDEFFVLPKDTNSHWFYYGGAFSLELTKFASKFQITKDKFKDFIDSINFNEVAREDDNSLPNINFIDHFDLDNKDIILNQNNFNILERLTNTKYKPTRYIYDKITSKIKVDDIDSNIAQKILNIAISKNNIELLKTAADKGANLDIKDEDDQTPLIWAISKNNPEIALALIDKGANLDIKDKDGQTPIHWATSTNNPEIALYLINKGANLDIQDKDGKTPLHLAIEKGLTDIARDLIDKGANLDIKGKYGKTPLHLAILHLAIYKNNPEIALALIEKGANLDIQDGDGHTPLQWAIYNRTEIALALINKGANLDIKDKYGQSPLKWAIYENNTEIALALINKGANLDIKDKYGQSPLHLAIEKGLTGIARDLIDKGANLDIKGKYGKTPLHLAILHLAIYKNNPEIALALIEKGANLDIQDGDGQTPLDWAISKKNTEIALALIEKGAKGNNMNKVALLVTSIISIIATISLLITAILLPPLSIILFGCAGATGLSSIILLDSYFKSPEYITMNKPSVSPINKTKIKVDNMAIVSEKNVKQDEDLKSYHQNNPPQ